MTVMKYMRGGVRNCPHTSKSLPCNFGCISQLRIPTDPFFYADVVLENIQIGSRYWIARASDLSTVLAMGTAATTMVTETNIPAYSNPMLMIIRIRSSSSGTKYKPFTTYSNLVKTDTNVYILQTEDGIAT